MFEIFLYKYSNNKLILDILQRSIFCRFIFYLLWTNSSSNPTILLQQILSLDIEYAFDLLETTMQSVITTIYIKLYIELAKL